MTLTEIIEEYDRREALMAEMLPGEVKSDEWRARDAFARRHFARLLAVVKAAVRVREEIGDNADGCNCRKMYPDEPMTWCWMCRVMHECAAFDVAAAGGER